MTADCKARGVPIFWVLVPRVGRKSDAENKPALIETAQAAGFTRIVDLTDRLRRSRSGSAGGRSRRFPSQCRGHARLAQRLDDALKALPEVGRIWETRLGQDDSDRRRLGRGRAHAGSSTTSVRPAGLRCHSGGPTGMKTPESGSVNRTRIGILQSMLLLVVAIFPWPACWERVRGAVDSAARPS